MCRVENGKIKGRDRKMYSVQKLSKVSYKLLKAKFLDFSFGDLFVPTHCDKVV